MNKLLAQDIAPQQPRQRRAKCHTKGAVVDADDHGVDGAPEVAVRDGCAGQSVDVLPGLNDAGEEDGGSDVGACELVTRVSEMLR